MSNTHLQIARWTTDEIERELDHVQTLLLTESFGRDYAAYYDLVEKRSTLLQEVKRRKGR